MKRFFAFYSALIIYFFTIYAGTNETLNFEVQYKWGLIQKVAGDVEISKHPKNDGYELKLIASTRPWADRIYKVRDTLMTQTKKEKYKPIRYKSVTHEKDKHQIDEINYSYSGNNVVGHAKRHKVSKNGEISEKEVDLEAEGAVYDMMSVYFFLRDINYEKMKPEDSVKATIFSGDKSEQLTVRCLGKETIKLKDKTEAETWHVQFKFTTKGGKKSSDDINCWITTDPDHIPLLIVGSLPIGQIRVNLVKRSA